MRKLTRSPKKEPNLPLTKPSFKVKFTGIQKSIVFRCDTFLLDKIKNTLTSQHLAGNYEYANLSAFFSFSSPCLPEWNAFNLSART